LKQIVVVVNSDVVGLIFEIFSPKILATKWRFLFEMLLFCKYCMITLIFKKNAYFPPENGQKSQNFAIITSTPGQWEK
jgi:hypothetical protein